MSDPVEDTRMQRGDSSIDEAEKQAEQASTDPNVTPKQSIIRGASLVVYPKGHAEIYIPQDVVSYILTFTRRGQLSVCSRVCKLWRLLTSDPYLGWCVLHTHTLSGEYFHYMYVDCSVEFCSGISVEGIYNDPEAKTLSGFKIQLVDSSELPANPHIHPGDYTCALFEACKDHPRLWRWDVCKNTVTNIKDPTYRRATLGAVFYELRFEVNVKEFEKLVFEKKTVPALDIIIHIVDTDRWSAVQEDNKFTKPRIPQRSLYPQKQPYGFKPNINLYKYQLDAIAWMKSIEDNIDEVYDFCYLTPWRKAQSTVLFDFAHKPTTLVPVSEVGKHLISYTVCGGVLGDETGLGKTMEMIGLILANPGTPIEDEDDDAEGEADAEDNDEKDAALDDLFATDATLVVCPNHLVHQWIEEIQKQTNDVLSIVTLTNIAQVKSLKYKDIKNADVVVMSYQLMRNPHYFHIGHALQNSIKGDDERYRQTWVNAQLARVRKAAAPLRQSKPICDHFYWRRIIMDEVHEKISDYRSLLSALQSKFRWAVSETPFSTINVMFQTARILAKVEQTSLQEKLIEPGIKGYYSHIDTLNVDFMLSNLYWRNTEESVKGEDQIPPIVKDLVLLDFTDIEKIVYQYAPESQRRELCCLPGTNFMTLSAYKTSFLDTQKDRKQGYEGSIENQTGKLQDEQQKLLNPLLSPTETAEISRNIECYENKIRDARLNLIECTESIRLINAAKSYDGPNVTTSLVSIFAPIKPHLDDVDQKMEEANTTKSSDKEEDASEEHGKREERQKEEQEDKMETKREEEKGQQTTEQDKKETDKRGAINDQHAKVEEESGEEEEEEDKLTEEEVGNMTVAQLNKELKKRRIEAPPKSLKKVLLKLLLTSLSTSKEKETSIKEVDEKREKEVNSEEATAEDEEKEVERSEEELEEMTIVQLKALMKKRGIEVPNKVVKRVLVDLLLENSQEDMKQKSQNSTPAETTASKRKLESVREASAKKVKKSAKPKKTDEEEGKGKDKKGEKEENKEKKTPLGTPSKHQKFLEAQMLKYLVEQYGTKLGNLIQYLRKLWADDPNARVIMFSQFTKLLNNIARILAENDIESAYVEGNVMRRERALESFKKADSDIRVLLMSLTSTASGSNLIAATHIIIIDPVQGSKKEALATEQQAIGRAHRQGQEKQVTIVRFIIKKTVEYDTYVQNYLADEELAPKENDPSRPKLVHSNSVDAVLATIPTVRRSKSIIEFVSNLQ